MAKGIITYQRKTKSRRTVGMIWVSLSPGYKALTSSGVTRDPKLSVKKAERDVCPSVNTVPSSWLTPVSMGTRAVNFCWIRWNGSGNTETLPSCDLSTNKITRMLLLNQLVNHKWKSKTLGTICPRVNFISGHSFQAGKSCWAWGLCTVHSLRHSVKGCEIGGNRHWDCRTWFHYGSSEGSILRMSLNR